MHMPIGRAGGRTRVRPRESLRDTSEPPANRAVNDGAWTGKSSAPGAGTQEASKLNAQMGREQIGFMFQPHRQVFRQRLTIFTSIHRAGCNLHG